MAWAPDYAEVDALATYERIPDDVDDAQLARAITTASRAVDRHCRRQFGLLDAPAVRYYQPRWDARLSSVVVDIDDLMTTTGLEVDGEATASPVLLPRNAAADGMPWRVLKLDAMNWAEVAVTALWGWTEVPDAVKQATLLQASRFLARRNAPFGIAGSPDTGSEMRLLAKVDPDVAVSLEPYRRKARPQ